MTEEKKEIPVHEAAMTLLNIPISSTPTLAAMYGEMNAKCPANAARELAEKFNKIMEDDTIMDRFQTRIRLNVWLAVANLRRGRIDLTSIPGHHARETYRRRESKGVRATACGREDLNAAAVDGRRDDWPRRLDGIRSRAMEGAAADRGAA